MIDLTKLKHVIAVARAGSFSLAARNISISQSALTRSVKILEETYSVVIFDRGKSGAKLTLEGAQFVRIAEEAIRRAQNIHDDLKSLPSANAPRVSFGMGPMTAASLLPAVLPVLENEQVRNRITIQSNSALQLMLRQGDLDFFVGGMRKGVEFHALANQFSVEPIGITPMSLMVRPGHPLTRSKLTPDILAGYPTAGGSFVRETFGLATIQRTGLQEPSVELDDYSLLIPFILNSDHILIASQILAHAQNGFQLETLPISMDISDQSEWAIVSSQRAGILSVVQRAIAIIRQVAQRALR